MEYITLIHALNIPCKLDTTGDWHIYDIQWEHPHILESDDSLLGDYGIEKNKKIPFHEELYNVANHIRACLDYMYIGQFTNIYGMKDDYINTDFYNLEIFEKVLNMKQLSHWEKINQFMKQEYKSNWEDFLKLKGIE